MLLDFPSALQLTDFTQAIGGDVKFCNRRDRTAVSIHHAIIVPAQLIAIRTGETIGGLLNATFG
jgi:hypothetical protein